MNKKKGGNTMKDYRNVVICVNGSKDVLVEGLKLIHDEKCNVTVVKVVPTYEGDLSMVGVKNIGDLLNSGAERELSEIMEVAKKAGSDVKVRVEEGDLHEKIVETAEEEHADLIIMGARKKNFIEKLLNLETIDKVTNQAPCPVLLVNS
jgi:nucleotide-binding universal stress UspA family protein